MARSFGNNPANFLERSASLISNSDPRPISVAIWLRANNRGVTHAIFNNTRTGNPRCLMLLGASGANDVQRLYSGGYAGDSDTFTLSTVAWTHLGWSWNSDNAIAYFLDGAANGSTSRALSGTGTDLAVIGTLDGSTGGFDVDGDQAEFAVWNAILTSAEWAALAASYSPLFIRPQSLVSYVQIVGRNSPELDRVDATTWTVNGTLTVAPHAPMIYPAPVIAIPSPIAVPSARIPRYGFTNFQVPGIV